ncbi:MAG: cytochrome c biogenesis protein CcdA [Candidatus Micrarchaeota archaeon]
MLMPITSAVEFKGEGVSIDFFYGIGCPHCGRAEPVIDELESKYPELTVRKHEIYQNRTNLLLMNEYFDAHNVPEGGRGVPAVFIGGKSIVGDTPIIENLETEILATPSSLPTATIKANETYASPTPTIGPTATIKANATTSEDKLKSLSIVTVIGAALVDSINPCAIAVLLILMGALLATGDKKKALVSGFAFTTSIYISYFLFGLGLFSALQISGLSYLFYKIVGILAIIIGLANLKDYFWYGGGGFVMEIPRSWRPALKGMLGSVTSPFGAFLMGFVVCLFELPCTGGPYIFILGLLAEKSTMMGAIPILLLYNLFFVLPLIIITLLLHFGFASVEKATQWKDSNLRVLHLIAGIIMLLLGLVVVLGLV